MPKRSRDLLATLLSNIEGMVYRCRHDEHWTMEFVSEGCFALTGYRPDELLANRVISYEDVTHPDDRVEVRRVIDAAIQEGKRYEIEYRIVTASGQTRWVWERGAAALAADGGVDALEGIVQDISARRSAEQSLKEAERRYRSIFENTIEGIFQSTPRDGYVTVNPALARMYGYDSPEDLISGLRDIDRQLYVQPGRRAEFIRAMEERGAVANFESQVRRRDGSTIWISENARAVRDTTGALLFYEGTVEDISDRKRRDFTIQHQATHDAVTGLPNRLVLHERLGHAIDEAHQRRGLVALLYCDLDQFKLVNDSLGHEAGDQLLKIIARRLRNCVREDDVVTRQGGDEFVVLLTGCTSKAEVQLVASRILAAVVEPCAIAGREFSASCSIGVSLSPGDGADQKSMLRCADAAMYRAKDLGRNNVQFFSSEMHTHSAGRLDLLMRLQHAIERNEFRLHYEPKYELATGRIVGAEALIRWQTSGALAAPASFIPLAEETGLIIPIGEWVLRTACKQNRAWQEAGLPIVPVSVNLSRRQIARGDIAALVAEVLAEAKLEPELLELEITESAVMHDGDKAATMLRRLRALGISISMDDFGTGYSSLAYLRRFQVQRLKIDRAFLRDAHSDPDSAAIVRAIVSLAHNLDLRVLAEGVETQEQFDFLCGTECDEFQGWFMSKPLEPAAFAALLTAQQRPVKRSSSFEMAPAPTRMDRHDILRSDQGQ